MYLMAQGSALLQIMHTAVSARDSRRVWLLSRALTPVAWIFRTLRLTAPTDTWTGRAVHLMPGDRAFKLLVNGLKGDNAWYPHLIFLNMDELLSTKHSLSQPPQQTLPASSPKCKFISSFRVVYTELRLQISVDSVKWSVPKIRAASVST